VPGSLGGLLSLRELNLSNNHLTRLPASLEQLSALSSLKLAANRLEVVPSGLATLTQLEELQLYGNNFSREKLVAQSINSNAVGRHAVQELQSRIKEIHKNS